MRTIFLQWVILLFAMFNGSSCKKENGTSNDPTDLPVEQVLLREMNTSRLPSPYYHFDYNIAGLPTFAAFASGLFMYDIVYNGNRVSEMQNKIAVRRDRLLYAYNNAGKVDTIRYADSNGIVYKKVYLNYDGQKLKKVVRERRTGNGAVLEKTMRFSYHEDGNLKEIKDQHHTLNGEIEATYIDLFEQYDNKVNPDGFSLLHNEFFEHLFILPGVQLQKNNPGKLTRTGDGVNYKIDYSYTYSDKNFPLTKTGEAVITKGSAAGQRFQTSSNFSYY